MALKMSYRGDVNCSSQKSWLGHHSLGGIKQLESYKETAAGQLSIESNTSSKFVNFAPLAMQN